MTDAGAEWDAKVARVIDEFRTRGGKVGGEFEGCPLLLLHSKDTGSGQERVNALMYMLDSGRYIIFASNSGKPVDPIWFGNLLATPQVEIEVGTAKLPVVASVVDEQERQRLYERQVESYPFFADYQKMTDRVIPVVALRTVPQETR
ncbi:nitroreductase/quinone reductase family protein [Streptomyces sp. NPDC006668]|jgi:deazaflavin-dependent oxidoreductase (nitroreductase family)|uniref:nitroreductase/quinone reductase family protein n=1 Tax=Streptomyces sp. NPDC006668 TaxID=3156903 RepID=UPI00340198C1